jgi:anti-sigma factor RsiW
MGSKNHPTDWQRQREQLSAYLDGELIAEEGAAIERHLPSCADCRAALVELRGVHSLLRALPAPVPPRSFALPPASRPAPTRRSTARPSWYAASQRIGSLAACIGLLLLLGTGIAGLFGASTLSPAGDSRYGSGSQTTADAPVTTATPGASFRTPSAVATPPEYVRTPNPGQIGKPTAHPQTSPELPIVPLTGIGLLAGGALVVVAGRVAARRT